MEVGYFCFKINKFFLWCVVILSDLLCNIGLVVKWKSDIGEGNNGLLLVIICCLFVKENIILVYFIKFYINMIIFVF